MGGLLGVPPAPAAHPSVVERRSRARVDRALVCPRPLVDGRLLLPIPLSWDMPRPERRWRQVPKQRLRDPPGLLDQGPQVGETETDSASRALGGARAATTRRRSRITGNAWHLRDNCFGRRGSHHAHHQTLKAQRSSSRGRRPGQPAVSAAAEDGGGAPRVDTAVPATGGREHPHAALVPVGGQSASPPSPVLAPLPPGCKASWIADPGWGGS